MDTTNTTEVKVTLRLPSTPGHHYLPARIEADFVALRILHSAPMRIVCIMSRRAILQPSASG